MRFSIAALTLLALTQVPAASGQAKWEIKLSKDAAGKVQRAGPPETSTVSEQTVLIAVTCEGVDCTTVEGRVTLSDRSDLLGQPLPRTGTSAGVVVLTLNRGQAATVGNQQRFLSLTAEGSPVELFALKTGEAPRAEAERTIPLSQLAVAECPRVVISGAPYSKRLNAAQVVVTPLGQVLLRPGNVIDEDDSLRVTLSGAVQLLPRLMVRRSSEFRVVSAVRIAGSDIQVQELPGMERHAAGQPPACSTRVVTLHDFAPGRGEVQISVRTEEGEDELGKFEFSVNPLHTGAFSLGIVRSSLADPTFGLFFNGTDSVITERENPSRDAEDPAREEGRLERERILYGVFYTPFFARLDLEKEKLVIKPTIGFALNDISDNVFLGGTVLIQSSISLMAGVHWGRVTRLDPRSGLDVGSTFDGSTTAIPTVRRWRGDLFLGAGLDLRAAAQFLRTAFGAKGGT